MASLETQHFVSGFFDVSYGKRTDLHTLPSNLAVLFIGCDPLLGILVFKGAGFEFSVITLLWTSRCAELVACPSCDFAMPDPGSESGGHGQRVFFFHKKRGRVWMRMFAGLESVWAETYT